MRLFRLLLAAAATLLFSSAAQADFTYTYNGNDFTTVIGPYTTSDSIQGSFTVFSAIAPNTVDELILPESLSFTDGVQTANTSDDHFDRFLISTDATGAIVDWDIQAYSAGVFGIFTLGGPTKTEADTGEFYPDYGFNNGEQGTWTTSITPEPSTITLLSLGLLSLVLPLRRHLT